MHDNTVETSSHYLRQKEEKISRKKKKRDKDVSKLQVENFVKERMN